ncbi:MAG: tetratricopeptide repeat protein [bacterium]|nr:tetratricopeptide repeat protein [bacterium]
MSSHAAENPVSRRAFWTWGAVVLIGAVLVFGGTLSYPFVHDDLTVITENPIVQKKGRALEALTTDYWGMRKGEEKRDRLYRPLTTLSLIANHALGGNDPRGYRVVNIALHVLASMVLFWLCARFGLGAGMSGAIALLFVLHPVHTEAVNAVVGRGDLLAAIGVFGGCALACGIKLRDGESPLRLAAGVCVFFVLAILAKEIGVALLIWGAIWWLWTRSTGAPSALADKKFFLWLLVSLAVLSIAYVGVRYSALGMLVRPVRASLLDNPLAHAALGERIVGAFGVLGRYFQLLVWPRPLTIDYSYAQVLPKDLTYWAVLGALCLPGWGWAAWRWRGTHPCLALGLAIFLAGYLPVSNLPMPIGTIMAERLLYLPSAGFLIAFVPLAAQALARWDARLALPLLVLLAALYAERTWRRNGDWSGEVQLWESAVSISPRSARSLRLYGQALARSGKFEQAIAPLEKAVRIFPKYDPAWVDLGIAQMRTRRLQEAEVSLTRGLELNAGSPEGHLALGVLYIGSGRLASGRVHLVRAVELAPHLVEARFNLGTLYLREGRRRAAVAQFRAALAVAPERGDVHHNLAVALMMEGDRKGAQGHALEAMRLGIQIHPALARALGLRPAP